MMTGADQPWWATDPTIAALIQSVEDEIAQAKPLPEHADRPDPVVEDWLSGASLRGLAQARDGLARAHAQYEQAVCDAREAGYSWAEIGRVLGVSKQALHRKFGRRLS